MEIHQIVIRPQDHTVIVLFKDIVGNRNNIVFDSAGNSAVQQLVAECEQKLPSDTENQDKSDIEQEITELEYRLKQLRQSIGVTA